MVKTLNTISIIIIAVLLIIFISEKFYPIEGFELIYEKKFYLAIAYIIIRLYRNIIMRKEQTQSK